MELIKDVHAVIAMIELVKANPGTFQINEENKDILKKKPSNR